SRRCAICAAACGSWQRRRHPYLIRTQPLPRVRRASPTPQKGELMSKSGIRTAVLALSLLAVSGAARAEITNCTEITAVPYFINTPGIYCLKQSLSLALVQGVAIQVQVDDVTIDLNGHTLANFSGAPAGVGWGITGLNLKYLTVRNGTIRGFGIGVYLENRSGNS